MVLRPKGEKPAGREGKILFINADRDYEAGRAQNYLRPEHIEKIVSTFNKYEAIPGYSAIVHIDAVSSDANGYSLNIRRYADNFPDPEPHDVRAHLRGGVPKVEVDDARKRYFDAHGLNDANLFVSRDADYLDFGPTVDDRTSLKLLVEEDAGVKAREEALHRSFATWWATVLIRLRELPTTSDPMVIRAEFLRSFDDSLLPVGLLDRFQLAGALVTWWEDQTDEFKTIAARGFDELVDGWVDTIRDVIEDTESKKEDRDAAREHKLVRRLLPDYLREIEEAASDVEGLENEKEEFERGPDDGDQAPSDESGEEAESRNYAKELKDEVKELKQSIADELDRTKALNARKNNPDSIAAAEHAGKDTALLRAELVDLEARVEPVLSQIESIKAKLKPYEDICDKLKDARKHLRDLERALLERLDAARALLTSDQASDLVLSLAGESLLNVLADYVTRHRQKVILAVETLWDKYRVPLEVLKDKRTEVSNRVDTWLQELSYGD